ncbi:rhodanese-like domain-containing protein [Jannaschia sp. LMIT008]|uniref:rhodanese-like domain-containing protein n=1 Tax=Jannaschia maritima TaxID=3032585 RepID=UPI0028120745|nr:rhodanese-like domain-containing protein [Jannaschia sp. LMIT008]
MPLPDPSRRAILTAGAAAILAGGAGWAAWSRDRFDGGAMTPREAMDAARVGTITLIDIRRPDEWARTGIPEGGHGIDMRRDDFAEALLDLTGGDRTAPVALICARGVRSDRMSARLAEAGFTAIVDVPEGMLGSAAGPGWVARGLPVVRP